jgi:hypothetical protein
MFSSSSLIEAFLRRVLGPDLTSSLSQSAALARIAVDAGETRDRRETAVGFLRHTLGASNAAQEVWNAGKAPRASVDHTAEALCALSREQLMDLVRVEYPRSDGCGYAGKVMGSAIKRERKLERNTLLIDAFAPLLFTGVVQYGARAMPPLPLIDEEGYRSLLVRLFRGALPRHTAVQLLEQLLETVRVYYVPCIEQKMDPSLAERSRQRLALLLHSELEQAMVSYAKTRWWTPRIKGLVHELFEL